MTCILHSIINDMLILKNWCDSVESPILLKRLLIPVYFILAFLLFLLFCVHIKTEVFAIYVLILMLFGLGIASIIYNYKIKQ